MKKGDVVLISVPFTDLSFVKVRPALVISNENYNTSEDDVVVLLITSNISRLSSEDYVIETNNPEFINTGLKQASAFRVGKIQTLHKNLLISKLGIAGPNTLKEIEKRLRNLLEL
jgi:mRNA interferase MazF